MGEGFNIQKEKVIANRLQAGAVAIKEALEYVAIEDLIFNIYLTIKDSDTKKLISFYESQLVLAKSNPKKFIDTRYTQVMEIVKWIKDNHKYRLFADFSMYIGRNFDNTKFRPIATAYITALMDTWASINYGAMWYGLDINDNPLYTENVYGNYDIPSWELLDKIYRDQKDPVKMAKYKKAIDKIDADTNFMRNNERNITNVVFGMIGLITEQNADIIYPFKDWYDHYSISLNLPRVYKPTEFYLNELRARTHLLASEGVVVHVFNAGMFSEIIFKEEFLVDGMVVLFKVRDLYQKKYTMGYIDLRNSYIYSCWRHTNRPEYCENFGNFVLEIYSHLTTNFEKNTNRLIALKQLESADEASELNNGQPGIYCEVHGEGDGASRHRGKSVTQKTIHHVNAFLRKGNASEMAIANARLYGIITPQGFTFVRPHIRGKNTAISGDK